MSATQPPTVASDIVLVPRAELEDFAYVMDNLISELSDPGSGALAARYRINTLLATTPEEVDGAWKQWLDAPHPIVRVSEDTAKAAKRNCTCHPDDRPAGECPQRFAASECQAAAGAGERAVKDFRWRAQQCRTNPDAFDTKAAAIWDLAADALEGKQ